MILFLLGCVIDSNPDTGGTATSEPCDACDGHCVLEGQPATSRKHVSGGVEYPSYPPTSGNHNPCWAEWGVHTEALDTENWVHNLEHGGVVFLYDPAALAAEDLTALTTWVQTLPEGRAILTPTNAPMDATVAAVAWQHRLLLGCPDAAALDGFFWDNIGHAPEDITANPAASCGSDSGM